MRAILYKIYSDHAWLDCTGICRGWKAGEGDCLIWMCVNVMEDNNPRLQYVEHDHDCCSHLAPILWFGAKTLLLSPFASQHHMKTNSIPAVEASLASRVRSMITETSVIDICRLLHSKHSLLLQNYVALHSASTRQRQKLIKLATCKESHIAFPDYYKHSFARLTNKICDLEQFKPDMQEKQAWLEQDCHVEICPLGFSSAHCTHCNRHLCFDWPWECLHKVWSVSSPICSYGGKFPPTWPDVGYPPTAAVDYHDSVLTATTRAHSAHMATWQRLARPTCVHPSKPDHWSSCSEYSELMFRDTRCASWSNNACVLPRHMLMQQSSLYSDNDGRKARPMHSHTVNWNRWLTNATDTCGSAGEQAQENFEKLEPDIGNDKIVGLRITQLEARLWLRSSVNLMLVSACRAFKLWTSDFPSTPEKLSPCSLVVNSVVYFSRLPLVERLISVVIAHSLRISDCVDFVPALLLIMLRSSFLKEGQSLSRSSAWTK